ncbi:MAG: hypothetical protein CMJ70_20485 [Planctomycetaceae bacterium]|nr:hypothetical protein [Planctomycetaceae bacterium]HAA68607.1 hypothetical protein [Planctomycetaceae bacterium]
MNVILCTENGGKREERDNCYEETDLFRTNQQSEPLVRRGSRHQPSTAITRGQPACIKQTRNASGLALQTCMS